jgi:hypothetical protein
MKPVDPRRWARPGDLLRSNRAILTDDGGVLPYETLALVVEVGLFVEFFGWLNMKVLVEGRTLSVQTSNNYWEHVDDHV